MRTITLNDGTVYTVSMCGEADGYLWIKTPDIENMMDAVTVFGNPEKTGKITHIFGENDRVEYTGYTNLVHITKQADGVTVCLQKAE